MAKFGAYLDQYVKAEGRAVAEIKRLAATAATFADCEKLIAAARDLYATPTKCECLIDYDPAVWPDYDPYDLPAAPALAGRYFAIATERAREIAERDKETIIRQAQDAMLSLF